MTKGPLSNREADVAVLILLGWCNASIADYLCVDVKTVKFHITKINRKVKSRYRGQFIARYYRGELGERVTEQLSKRPELHIPVKVEPVVIDDSLPVGKSA